MSRVEDRSGWLSAGTAAGSFVIDPAIGNIRSLEFAGAGRRIEPLHTAPWVAEVDVPAGMSPIERNLAGDFFCAAFGANDVDISPIHGWSANSSWSVLDRRADEIRLRLDRTIMGAVIDKTCRIAADAPLFYQQHLVSGGSGRLPVAHHPMFRLATTGRFSCSPKAFVASPEVPLEPGRHRLAGSIRQSGLAGFPSADGGTVDLSRLPIGDRHEDFVTLVEAAGSPLGWSAIIRNGENDVIFFLKDPRVLPATFLWHSNAGRDYAPWNGRHRGVLGIEDGCAAGAISHAAALKPNSLSNAGVEVALSLSDGRVHDIRHVTGAIPRPSGWNEVVSIAIDEDRLILTGDGGSPVQLAFKSGFFA